MTAPSTASSASAPKSGSSSGGGGNKPPNPTDVNHVWESHDSQAAWQNAVREDDDGNLIVEGEGSVADAIRRRRKRLEQNDYAQRNRRVVRDMIRYLYVLIDASRWMRVKDPVFPGGTRLDVTIEILQNFVQEYYDQNPLSHLGFILIKNGEAEILTQLSSSSKAHKLALQSVAQMAASEGPTGGGEFSLQNGIEVAGRSLGHQPRHGSREIVILVGALSTCDPGYLLTETLPRLKTAKVRVSTMAISAEMHICRKLAEETTGVVGVSLDKAHFRDWLLGQCVPPPTMTDPERQDFACDMVQMGFPTRTSSEVPTLVHATQDTTLLARTAYTCPQCQAKLSELPADCAVCGLKLVLSPHLARSFHHLFPVAPFSEISLGASEIRKAALSSEVPSATPSGRVFNQGGIVLDSSLSTSPEVNCFACLRAFGGGEETNDAVSSAKVKKDEVDETLRFQCPECLNFFCADCDAYMHESLHNCPGCLCR
ncbi:transcription factor IIH subunit 2 [Seminavis robusta]|uniref:General transcription factor IIH subunit n=1 Tax=Seminavis robusta TaxID=568900 RepID=A0A9N8H0M6_9STRA|nr:transcription factor IIH subunit 2 [Seminavis robusta]|eukprot:Sro4_g003210.1 transcription factor IIH subunit 2 (484) ;mRNA; r:75103-76554